MECYPLIGNSIEDIVVGQFSIQCKKKTLKIEFLNLQCIGLTNSFIFLFFMYIESRKRKHEKELKYT